MESEEHMNAKKEPPWPSALLPAMPRISVSSNSRARLSHRRPIILASPPEYPLRPLPSPSPPPFTSPLSEALPPPPPVSPPSRCTLHPWPASSSPDCAGTPTAAASPDASDAVPRRADVDSFVTDDSSQNRSSSGASAPSQLMPPTSDCAVSHSPASSVPILLGDSSLPAPPAASATPALQRSSCKEDHHDASENGEGLQMASVERLNEAEGPNSRNPASDSSSPGALGFSVAEKASSSSPVNGLEEMDDHRVADILVNQESCSVVGSGAEVCDVQTNGAPGPDECELEEGQLSGEWSGAEEEADDSEPVQTGEHSLDSPAELVGFPLADELFHPSQFEEIYSEERSEGSNKAKGKKKKKKHKKGEGSKKRSREKSKDKYKEVLKKRRTEGQGVDDASNTSGTRGKGTINSGKETRHTTGIDKFKKVPDNVSKVHSNKPEVDDGPEDGEILLESTKTNHGILSSLVEAEVGLWTTDDVDDQFISQMEEDGVGKKKRGPETAERKLKRKIAKRKKRAQKERELGIRRPPRTVQSKPVKVLCTHYMKGRCAKGDQCTFSHDAVPLTKQEPCKFLMSHSCLKGDDCPYSHDLRAFPCKFFHTRGLCYDGVNCQFSHGAISDEAREKLQKRVEKEKKDRITSVTTFDIPTPAFSSPLPPELDPDPLGWGTPNSLPTREGLQDPNPCILDRSSHVCSDPENGHTARSSDGHTSPTSRILSSPVCERPPCDSSNARKILEVWMIEEGMGAEQTPQEVPFTNGTSDDLWIQDPPSPLVPPLPTRTLAGTAVPILRGRQLGSRALKLEHGKTLGSPAQSVSKRQHTVESLLDEALRQ